MNTGKNSKKALTFAIIAIPGLALASGLIEGLETKLIVAAACIVTLRELVRQIIDN